MYNLEFYHIEGVKNKIADLLSTKNEPIMNLQELPNNTVDLDLVLQYRNTQVKQMKIGVQ